MSRRKVTTEEPVPAKDVVVPKLLVTNETRVELIHGGTEHYETFGPIRTDGLVPISLMRDFVDAATRHLPADVNVVVGARRLTASAAKSLT